MPQQDIPRSEETPKYRSVLRFFWPILAAASFCTLGGAAWYAFSQIHGTENRMYMSSELPWTGDGLTVTQLRGWWKSAKGDDRMTLRSNLYPIAQVKLGECDGSGLLVMTFHDDIGRQIGDPIHLPYNKGQFAPQSSAWLRAEGDSATARIEVGFDNEDGLLLQQLQTDTPLWRVRLRYRAEGERGLRHLGTVAVEPVEQKTEE